MQGNERLTRIKAYWNETSESEWYRSLRTEERIEAIRETPASAFHPAVFALMGKYLPDLKHLRVLLPSHLKAVLDRTIPLLKMTMVKQPDGAVRHEALVDFSRIHTVVICGCGFPHWEGNFDSLRQMCKTCFGNPEMICVPETPMLNVPAAAIVADPLLKRFEDAGVEYAASLRLSAKTVTALETPMISAEEYIRNVNGV